MFKNKNFQSIYVSLLNQQTETPQYAFMCKTCKTGFTKQDGVTQNDNCPVENCDGKIEIFDPVYVESQGIQLKSYVKSQENQQTSNDIDTSDIVDQDLLGEITEENEYNNYDESEFEEDEEEDQLKDDYNVQFIFQEDEKKNKKDLQEDSLEQEQEQELDEDDFDFDSDEDEDEQEDINQDGLQGDVQAQTQINDQVTKLISFTITDPSIIQALTKVQNGQAKIVVIPQECQDIKTCQPELIISSSDMKQFDIQDLNSSEETNDETQLMDSEQESQEQDVTSQGCPECGEEPCVCDEKEKSSDKIIEDKKQVNQQKKARKPLFKKYGIY